MYIYIRVQYTKYVCKSKFGRVVSFVKLNFSVSFILWSEKPKILNSSEGEKFKTKVVGMVQVTVPFFYLDEIWKMKKLGLKNMHFWHYL